MASEEAEDFRTIFIFVPPQGLPEGWSLTASRFAESLGVRHPGASTHRWSGESAGESLSFTFTTSSGAEAEGTVGLIPNGVAIKNCTSAEAAEFAHWLLHEVVPPDGLMQANIREGVEWDLPPVDLPRGALAELEHILTSRVADIRHFHAQLLGQADAG